MGVTVDILKDETSQEKSCTHPQQGLQTPAQPHYYLHYRLALKNFLKGNFISSPSNKKKKTTTGICRNIWLKVFWVLWFLFVLLSVTV